MDRDPLWVGSPRLEWPGLLLLWLVGLGIQPLINRPARPTDNAQIERNNRTWHEHVALGSHYASLLAVQTQTDQDGHDRLYHLPSRNPHCGGLPPMQALPQLAHPCRPYTPDREADLFALHRVDAYLATWEWERKVSPPGSISLADHNFFVSRRYVGHVVKLRFDPASRLFVVRAVDGVELTRFALPFLTPDYICSGGTNSVNGC